MKPKLSKVPNLNQHGHAMSDMTERERVKYWEALRKKGKGKK